LAKSGQYDAKQWGKAVNMFAAERFLTSKLEPETSGLLDMAWNHNPLSWTFLAFEYANVLSAFKNANIEGEHACKDCISESAVTALWKEAKLPKGFKHANGEDRLDFGLSHSLIKTMKITMFPKVTEEIHAVVSKDPDVWESISTLAQSFCGTDYEDCKWHWPRCGLCGIPGLKRLKKKFGDDKVQRTSGALKPDEKDQKEVKELPAEA